MSGMENKQLLEELGYDDYYQSTPDSRRMYQSLLNLDWHPGRFVGLKGKAVAVSNPSAHHPLVAKAVADATACIERAMSNLSGVLKPQVSSALHFQKLGRALRQSPGQWELRDGKLHKKSGE